MNILQLRKSTNILFTFILISMISCKAQKSASIIEIFKGVEIDANYEYSDSSIFKLNNKIYSLRQKAIYNEHGELDKLILYKTEGILEYKKEQLLKDKKIVDYYGFPFKQNWSYRESRLIKGTDKITVLKIKDTVFETGRNGITTFYKLE